MTRQNPLIRWTPERVAAVFDDADDGLTIEEFAAAIQLAPSRASRLLVRALDAGLLTRDGWPYVYRPRRRRSPQKAVER